ncbi:hypothetical protein [Natronosalvus vescus]|uniref:hypothetical protein n=1 Tax=Natronosalvus vescus TaxID=2953881 RepID=UPI00209119C1|nr:hypothetical protein [Natronosalvus vescus]
MNFFEKSNFTIFVVILMMLFIVFPVPFMATHDSIHGATYAVAHESTEAFDEVKKSPHIQLWNPTPVNNLSPASQEVFKGAKEQPQDTGSEYRPAGWQYHSHKGVHVCRPYLLVCDGVSEVPEFPVDGGAQNAVVGVLEYEDELYLVKVDGGTPTVAGIIDFFLKAIAFGPYTLFLGLTVVLGFQQKHKFAFAWVGFALVTAAFSFPYFQMFIGEFQSPLPFYVFAGVPWVVMIGGLFLGIESVQRTAEDLQTNETTKSVEMEREDR